jgi:RNA polymerase sigma-70 factor (ECF subfamily)
MSSNAPVAAASSLAASAPQDFEVVYITYYARVYNYILHLVGGNQRYHQLAEDLTQDSFVKAFNAFEQLRDHSHLLAWLYRIAFNTAMDTLRRRQRIHWHSIDLSSFEEEEDSYNNHHWIPQITAKEEDDPQVKYDGPQEAIQAALARLPQRYRVPLLLGETGYSYLEIAQALDISLSALKMRIVRARKMVEQYYHDEEVVAEKWEAAGV